MNEDLLKYLDAGTQTLGKVDDIVRDSEDGSGWTGVLDVDRVGHDQLPFQAQFAGVQFPDGLTDAEKRDYIEAHPRFDRGKLSKLKEAIEATLSGTKRAMVNERAGSAWRLDILTHPDDTPDEDATRAAILTQKPAALKLTYSASTVLTGQGVGGTNPFLTIDELTGNIDDLAPVWETL